jgi:glutamate-1-semialdehyde 2,1-aminomutase
MAHAKARVGSEPARSRIARPAAPGYAATLRDARGLLGGMVRDAKGRELADFCNDHGAVLLGWADREVEAAIVAERNSELLEIEAAGRLTDLIPGVEAVAFAPCFETVLADALLAAKALTGRDGAFFVDEAAAMVGDVAALEDAIEPIAEGLAAVVVRPLDAPRAYLAEARRLTRNCGALLIFDESKSAFRVHRAGAQGLSGVRPDMTLIGSVLANGRPLAARAGALAPMRAAPSAEARLCAGALAAACVVLDRVARVDPAQALRVTGAEVAAEVETRFARSGAAAWFELSGDPAWTLVEARDGVGADPAALEAALAKGLLAEGALSFGAHVPSLATGADEVGRLLNAYEAALPALVARAERGGFERRLTRRAS